MPTLGFTDNDGVDVGNKYVTKDYVMSTYPNLVGNFINVPGLWTWGNNANGQVGLNQAVTANVTTPVLIPSASGGALSWVQVSASPFPGCSAGIKTDGTLWMWGSNNNWRLGLGLATNVVRTSPMTPFGGGSTNWAQVSVGRTNTVAIKTDGTLWTWGFNSVGELGTNTTTNQSRSTPVQVGTATTWQQVSSGFQVNGAIKTDGTLWTWGSNTSGECGAGDLVNKTQPVTTSGAGTGWKQVSMGNIGGGAVKTDGSLWMWGSNNSGRVGVNSSLASAYTSPVTPIGANTWKFVNCNHGSDVTFAIKTDGTLWGWGSNSNGLLGDGTIVNKSSPVTVAGGGTSWKSVGGGIFTTAAIKTDGTIWTWGSNSSLQLSGLATNVSRSSPGTIAGYGTYWKSVVVGEGVVHAIKEAEDW